jgi:hypothetical protein
VRDVHDDKMVFGLQKLFAPLQARWGSHSTRAPHLLADNLCVCLRREPFRQTTWHKARNVNCQLYFTALAYPLQQKSSPEHAQHMADGQNGKPPRSCSHRRCSNRKCRPPNICEYHDRLMASASIFLATGRRARPTRSSSAPR